MGEEEGNRPKIDRKGLVAGNTLGRPTAAQRLGSCESAPLAAAPIVFSAPIFTVGAALCSPRGATES